MKEVGKDLTRIGTGHYHWEFAIRDGALKIIKHKVYIHTMLEIHDTQSKQLKAIQEKLEYPWVEKNVVRSLLKRYEDLTDITDYLARGLG